MFSLAKICKKSGKQTFLSYIDSTRSDVANLAIIISPFREFQMLGFCYTTENTYLWQYQSLRDVLNEQTISVKEVRKMNSIKQ